MLIIFDLDDTLIDTTGSIFPLQLQKTLVKMQKEGLPIEDFSWEWERFIYLNSISQSGEEALKKFLEPWGVRAEERIYEEGLKTLYGPLDEKAKISLMEGAQNLLYLLKEQQHQLAVVTIGKPEIQHNKMKKSGLDSSLFSTILVVEEGGKKEAYQHISSSFLVNAENVLVCGDRIMKDLAPAKELGLWTVHFRAGRKETLPIEQQKMYVDFFIENLADIEKIIEDLS